MTHHGNSFITFGAIKKKLSDIEFLSIKEFEGKRVDVDDQQQVVSSSAETDLATQTANTSKDMYLASASFSVRKQAGATASEIFRLYANAVLIEEIETSLTSTGIFKDIFKTKSVKVATGEIIKITGQHGNAASTLNYSSKLILFEEDTGVSPAI